METPTWCAVDQRALGGLRRVIARADDVTSLESALEPLSRDEIDREILGASAELAHLVAGLDAPLPLVHEDGMRLSFAAIALVFIGCGSKASPLAASAEPSATAPLRPSATASTDSKAVAASAAPSAAPAPIPSTPIPTIADWKAAKPLEVTGAKALGCVAEGVREWVRVSCRETGLASGGPPVALRIVSGKTPEMLTFVQGGVVSVQFRFVPGFHLRVLFGFDTFGEIFPLEVQWPESNANQPTPIGAFADVPVVDQAIVDACPNIEHLKKDYAPFRPECLRTLGTAGCNAFFECTWHEPSGFGVCADHEVHVFGTANCERLCASELECPEGFKCVANAMAENNAKVCERS